MTSAAVAEAYAPIPCASGQNGGGIGIHYVNGEQQKDDLAEIARLRR